MAQTKFVVTVTTLCSATSKNQTGFTLIEVLMVIAILGVISVVSITYMTSSIDEGRFQATVERMKQIRNAMIGDLDLKENNTRFSFGFLGDIGALPTLAQGIAGLITNPSLPAWSINSTVHFGAGWNGPYLTSADAATNFTLDGWGRAIVYNPSANPPTLTSYGADGVAGGTGYDSDIIVELPNNLLSATVHGFITSSSNPYTGTAGVDLNSLDGAGNVVTLTTVVTALEKGYFSFAGVPLGQRSVTVYIPSKAAPTTTIGPSIITVDSANYVIPSGVLDTNVTAGGACSGVGVITFAAGTSLSGGNQTLNFHVNVSTNVNVQQIGVTSTNGTTWNSATLNGTIAACSGANSLYVCPVNDNGTLSTLTPNILLNSGSTLAMSIAFQASMSGAGTATIQFNHNLGCDQIVIGGL